MKIFKWNLKKKKINESFHYQSPSFLKKDLKEGDQAKNDKIVKNVNESLIDLRNSVNSKETPKNENPNKVINTIDKILNFNKQQKGKWLKILMPKQMLQRLPIALAQIKTGNTSKNFLNEICQIINSLYQAKEFTKRVCYN